MKHYYKHALNKQVVTHVETFTHPLVQQPAFMSPKVFCFFHLLMIYKLTRGQCLPTAFSFFPRFEVHYVGWDKIIVGCTELSVSSFERNLVSCFTLQVPF